MLNVISSMTFPPRNSISYKPVIGLLLAEELPDQLELL